MRPDVGSRIHLRRWRDDGAGMDAGRQGGFGKEQRQRLGEGHARIGHADQHFARAEVSVPADDNGRGGALFGAGEEFLVFRKSQVARLGHGRRGEAFEWRLAVTQALRLASVWRFRRR